MKYTVALSSLLVATAYDDSDYCQKCRNGYDGQRSLNRRGRPAYFNRVSVFPICSQLDPTCDVDTETVAEIVVATPDGMTLVYSDSELEQIGLIDLTDPEQPMAGGTIPVDGEPTSVAIVGGKYALAPINTSEDDFVDTSGSLLVIDIETKMKVTEFDLGGQPDAVAVSPDGKYAAIAIENERDEDLGEGGLPQMPPGALVIVDMSMSTTDPSMWTLSTVSMTGLDGVFVPEDPEPEHVSINSDNIAVVTLQENNALVLVDCATATVMKSFTAGMVDLFGIDTEEEGIIDQTNSLLDVPRKPGGVTWIDTRYFATADNGDWNGGSRGFTIYDSHDGSVAYTSGSELELLTAAIGHYPEERSGNKGNEPENVAFGKFGKEELLFVNSERSSTIFIYDVKDRMDPQLVQVLPVGVFPEGSYVIPHRDLLVVASEVDDRGDNPRSVINVYCKYDDFEQKVVGK